MANGKKSEVVAAPDPAIAYHDFYKTNGGGPYLFFTEGPSLTRQEFAEECDINSIMKRYEGHDIGSIMRRDVEPQYADFTVLPTNLLEYMEQMHEAEQAFMTLPASVRRTFDNSAVEFVAFASDPSNIDQMRAWGLAAPKPPEKAEDAPGSAPAASPSQASGSSPGTAAGGSTHGST